MVKARNCSPFGDDECIFEDEIPTQESPKRTARQEQNDETADQFEALIAKTSGSSKPKFARPDVVRAEVIAMLNGKLEWDKAEPIHFVELAAGFHERVYGVADEEMGAGKQRGMVVRIAASMLKSSFKGNAEEMAGFVKWAWKRERSREQWRRDQKREGGRLSVRGLFSRRLLTDYKVAKSRGV